MAAVKLVYIKVLYKLQVLLMSLKLRVEGIKKAIALPSSEEGETVAVPTEPPESDRAIPIAIKCG